MPSGVTFDVSFEPPAAAADDDEVSLGEDVSDVVLLVVVDSSAVGASELVGGASLVGASDVAAGVEPDGVLTLAVSLLHAASPNAPAMATAPTMVRRNMLLDMTFLRCVLAEIRTCDGGDPL
ncbi:hypothetical protein GCM10011492_16250 [Flexivirga endophytica]|uniref:Uncharacterized protein n=1 Tax=Flexivirga endophytica TaxID=1849103 RepID=A0A916WSK8_9MICO|nr:hypothetical protein GCM10011492_16250 [Flexivirga endophytica]GHB55206.1 hypothetical protein GCM10008112_25560 [Flexivirga endophytica]